MPINFHFDVWEEVANEIDMSKTKNGLKLDGFLLYVDGIASRLRAHRESIEQERISAARNLVLAAEMKKMAEVEEEIASSREESRLAEEPDTPEYLVRFANMTALVFSALVTTSAYVTPPA